MIGLFGNNLSLRMRMRMRMILQNAASPLLSFQGQLRGEDVWFTNSGMSSHFFHFRRPTLIGKDSTAAAN